MTTEMIAAISSGIIGIQRIYIWFDQSFERPPKYLQINYKELPKIH